MPREAKTSTSKANLSFLSLEEAAALVRHGEVSSLELTNACLAQIERHGERLAAFTKVFADEARERASELDRDQSRGKIAGPLHGIPVAVKDLMDVAGYTNTCGTEHRRNAPPAARNAAALQEWLDAGAILVGTTNLHEWAYGGTSSNPHFGFVRNPWDETRIPGGSSGGSGVAVATGMAFTALGTDTGGSVRIPAACTGTAALKVTTGCISTALVHPLSWTLDTVGPHGRRVADLSIPFDVSARSGKGIPPNALRSKGVAGTRFGLVHTYYFDPGQMDPGVHRGINAAIEGLRSLGADFVDIEIPELHTIMPSQYAVLLAESAAVHSGPLRANRPAYGEDVQGLIALGDTISAVDYINALRHRSVVWEAFKRAFRQVDFLVAPGIPLLAYQIGDTHHSWPDGSEETVMDAIWRYTYPSNFVGIPSLCQPCAVEEGLPVSLQLVGPPNCELALLELGRAIEEQLAWSFTPPGYAD